MLPFFSPLCLSVNTSFACNISAEKQKSNSKSAFLNIYCNKKRQTLPGLSGRSFMRRLICQRVCAVESVAARYVVRVRRAVSIKDLHSMLHVFCYRAKRAGIPESIIAKFVGHKVLAMTHHYADHDTDEELRAEIRKLPPLFIGEFDTGETAARQRLAQLAYSLPIETVENLLGIARLHGYLPVPLSRSDTRCR